ncbi:MAG: TIGR02391 family protein [Helicobacteraceae bacterium]
MQAEKLKMSFDPHTIEHLGIKMYSALPNAIAELIANAYDAEANIVNIELRDNNGSKSISVIDDGIGMTFDEINNNFLRIGRKRRIEDGGMSPTGLRKITGRKGLGKLAFFGIGDTINIRTKKNGKCVKFTLRWQDLINSTASEYEPIFEKTDCQLQESGTTIELKDLKRVSPFSVDALAVSLSRLFNFFDDSFKVYISYSDGKKLQIDDRLKYDDLDRQIEWSFPNNGPVFNDYLAKNNVSGLIISTKKPLKPVLRGITLFAHGRFVNAPEFFGVGESSHAYSYLTGWLNVDFIDELEEDLVSTDRQSLNWDLPVTTELRSRLKDLLRYIEKDWREKRKIEKHKRVSSDVGVNVGEWYDKLPNNIRSNVESIVDLVIEESEFSEEKQGELIGALHTLVPEYPYYHWRHLHQNVQDASRMDYDKKDFYRAFDEAVKRYISEVGEKSGSVKPTASQMMGDVFGKSKDGKSNVLKVANKYKKTNGLPFMYSTIENIEEGQKFLSMGVVSGARNPVAHEEIAQLRDSELFTEMDCLDMLSLLSHLFRRLDNAEKDS